MHFALATIDRGIIPPHCLISDEHAMCKRCTHSQCEMTSALYLWTQTCVHCKLQNHDVLDTVVTIEHDSFSFVCARCTALYSVFTLFVISTIIQHMSFPHTHNNHASNNRAHCLHFMHCISMFPQATFMHCACDATFEGHVLIFFCIVCISRHGIGFSEHAWIVNTTR